MNNLDNPHFFFFLFFVLFRNLPSVLLTILYLLFLILCSYPLGFCLCLACLPLIRSISFFFNIPRLRTFCGPTILPFIQNHTTIPSNQLWESTSHPFLIIHVVSTCGFAFTLFHYFTYPSDLSVIAINRISILTNLDNQANNDYTKLGLVICVGDLELGGSLDILNGVVNHYHNQASR